MRSTSAWRRPPRETSEALRPTHAEGRRAAALVLALAVLLPGALAGGPAAAQTGSRESPTPVSSALPAGIERPPFELSASAGRNLRQLQEDWLQWMSAFYQGDAERAEPVVRELLATAETLGLPRLSDLSVGAAAVAASVSGEGEAERAAWALETAEALDPGRPEAAFARARVARRSGNWPLAVVASWDGYGRLASVSPARSVATADALLWLLLSLLVAGALFVAVEAVLHGGALTADLVGWLERRMPPSLARLLVVVLLAWPLLLPGGAVWLVLYLSVLLWAYLGASERTVVAFLWLLLAVTPWLLAHAGRHVEASLERPERAICALAEGRLYGDLLRDLGELVALLPDEVAVDHLLADFHRGLGQWEVARRLYGRVLAEEPENPAVLLDLGAYYFNKRDLGTAARTFERAIEADPGYVAAYFNLHRTLAEDYLTEDAERILREAQRIDEGRVSSYVEATGSGIVTVEGWRARIPRLRALLARRETGRVPLEAPWGSLAVAAAAALFAVGLARLRSAGVLGLPPPSDGGPIGGVWRLLVPGLPSLEEGRGVRGYLALVLPVSLLLLPAVTSLGWHLPLGVAPVKLGLVVVAVAGIATQLAVRWLLLRRREAS